MYQEAMSPELLKSLVQHELEQLAVRQLYDCH
jgi:hypothetical protein